MSHYLVTYATHAHGMYDNLKTKFPNIVVGGWGTTWTGFMDKFNFMIEFLNKLNADDIVIFVDGFDTIINGNVEEAVLRFKEEFVDCKVVVSYGTIEEYLHPYIKNKMFGTFKTVANSGLYMGYAHELKELLTKATKTNHMNDDQRALNLAMKDCNFNICIDYKNRIFQNLSHKERKITDYNKLDAIFLQCNGEFQFNMTSIKKWIGIFAKFLPEVLGILIIIIIILNINRKTRFMHTYNK